MARPLRIAYPGAFYHITSRGNDKKGIFKDQRDRERFLSYLESATDRYEARIHAYCLMNNHYHILLETLEGNLSQIMHHINGAYTTYFNIKYQRVGHLFQGRFKAILVQIDEYAKELSRYIHLNPVRAKMMDKPEDYAWSSYRYYIGLDTPPYWLNLDFILGYFGNTLSQAQKRYRAFVDSMVGRKYDSPLKDVVGSTILGTESFVEEIRNKYLSNREFNHDQPALKALIQKPSIEEIMKEVESVFGDNQKLGRGVAIYLCHRHTAKKLKDIGSHFGIGESGVSQASRRIALMISQDSKLKEKIEEIENKLNLSKNGEFPVKSKDI